MLDLEDGDIHIYLSPLSSLLEVEEDSGIVFHHSSFMDFMKSPEWSKSYYVSPGLSLVFEGPVSRLEKDHNWTGPRPEKTGPQAVRSFHF